MRILSLDELLKELENYIHFELHVHHTWKPSHKSFNGNNHITLQENMRSYHMTSLGWDDIGQHVTLMPDGKFVTGRAFDSTPCSIYGMNSKNGIPAFACEVLGNFDVQSASTSEYNDMGYDVLQSMQYASIIGLAKYFDKKGRYIRFHRENSTKTCPGNSIDKDRFMADVKYVEQTPKPIIVPQFIGYDEYLPNRRIIHLTKDTYISIEENEIEGTIILYAKGKGYKVLL